MDFKTNMHKFKQLEVQALANARISEYSIPEELLNSITHGIGALLSVAGLVMLCIQASAYGSYIHIVSYSIFGSTLILLYSSSFLYHTFSNTRFNKVLKKIDHLTIYFLIAGTYSPFTLAVLKESSGWIMFQTIWGLAAVGCVFKFSKNKLLQRLAFINYLLMGWLILIVFDELTISISSKSLYLLVTGGVLYTTGVIFYLWDKLPFNHSIWHLFVLGGSTAHYFSIYFLI